MAYSDLASSIPIDELIAEQNQIEHTFRSMKASSQIKKTMAACLIRCGAKFNLTGEYNTSTLKPGGQEICFGDCMNINLEKGPFLRDIGPVAEDAVPKKFVWAHSI